MGPLQKISTGCPDISQLLGQLVQKQKLHQDACWPASGESGRSDFEGGLIAAESTKCGKNPETQWGMGQTGSETSTKVLFTLIQDPIAKQVDRMPCDQAFLRATVDQ